jgi:transposase
VFYKLSKRALLDESPGMSGVVFELVGSICAATLENINLQLQLLMKNTRRKHSDSFKTEVVLEALKVRKTLAELAQEYQLSPAQIHSWKAAFLSNAPLSFGAKHKRAVAADNITVDLFNQIGRLKMENEWLRKGNWLAWSRLRQKSRHFLSDEADFCRP